MTFPTYEHGEDTGSPISLLRFESDALDAPILWTDVAFPVTRNGETYQPIPIKVGNVANDSTLDKAKLDLEVPTDSEVPMLFRHYPIGGTLSLTIFYGHDGDPAGEFVTIWVGRVVSVAHQDSEGIAVLDCQPISTAMRRAGLRRNYQRTCQHTLYGPRCKVDRAAHTMTLTVREVSNGVILFDEVPDAHLLNGGTIEWVRQIAGQIPLRDLRMITEVAVVGGRLAVTTLSPAFGVLVGAEAILTKGCDRSLDTCNAVFNNAPNYGGMPWIPVENPAGGTNIY